MRQTRDILRLRWKQGLSVRDTAQSVDVGVGTVSETTNRAQAAGLEWEAVEKLSDAELEERLYPKTEKATDERAKPDPVYIYTELKRPG